MTDTFARMRQLIGTPASWAANDLVIGDGEIAVEKQPDGTVKLKFGNGSLPYSALPFLETGGGGGGPGRTMIVSLIGNPLNVNEVLAAIMPPLGETWTFASNLTGSTGKKLAGGVNPAATFVISFTKNGTLTGTISISTAGLVSFATSGGAPFALTGGTDTLTFAGPATASLAVGYVFTIVATTA